MSVESLAQALLEGGILDVTTVEARAGRARTSRQFIEDLISAGETSETNLLNQLARVLSVPRYDPRDRQPEPDALSLIDLPQCEEMGVLPVALRGGGALLWVATCDPTDEPLMLEIARRTGRRVKACLIGPRELARAVQQARTRLAAPTGFAASAFGMPAAVPVPGYAAGMHRPTVPPLAPTYPPRSPFFPDNPLMPPPMARPAPLPSMPSFASAPPAPTSAPAPRAPELQRLEDELAQTKQVVKILAQLLVERGLLDGEELKRRLRAERERRS